MKLIHSGLTDLYRRPQAILAQGILWLILVFSHAGNAAQQSGDFFYEVTGSDITITTYWGRGGRVAIPGTLDGMAVTSIASWAFFAPYGLTNLILPSSVTSIGDRAFFCPALTQITVDVLNPQYSDREGVLFNKEQSILIQYPAARVGNNYDIPSSVTSIGYAAFCTCTRLTSITLPNGITEIGDYAFARCAELTSVYFAGDTPTNVGASPFESVDKAIVYYLPGALGWDSTFGGRPTALWQPRELTGDVSFGVRTNQFGFNITWASGRDVVVEACADLSSPVWSPVSTNNLASGESFYFSDPQWTNYPARFYRLRSQ